jgi:hypothetical protein
LVGYDETVGRIKDRLRTLYRAAMAASANGPR